MPPVNYSLASIEQLLASAVVRLRIREPENGDWEGGSGFLVSPSLVVTAWHNLPDDMLDGKQSTMTAFMFHNLENVLLVLEYIPEASSERHDVVALRVVEKPNGLELPYLPIAWLPPDMPLPESRRVWQARHVAIYGFPFRAPETQAGQAGRFVVGILHAGQPLEEVDLGEQYGDPAVPTGTTIRLRGLADNTHWLPGISGAPIFDTQLGMAIGVQHGYRPRYEYGPRKGDHDAHFFYGTPLCRLQWHWPDFQRQCNGRVLHPNVWDWADLPRRPPGIVHTLRRAHDFQDRPELYRLRRFWRTEKGRVIGLVGLGGAGKTALAERFLCELPGSSVDSNSTEKRQDLPPPDSLFTWSFYESPNGFECIQELAAYVRGARAAVHRPSDLLATIKRGLGAGNGRTLLVLDGLEMIQREDGTRGRLSRDASALRELMQWAASGARGIWLVVTTRFPIVDLADYLGAGYEAVMLDQLPDDAARSLLRTLGVRGSDTDLGKFIEANGRHPLTLSLLGNLIVQIFGGDPHKAPELREIIENPDPWDPQQQRLVRVLARYEDDLDAGEIVIMKAISSFRMPVDVETLQETCSAEAGFQNSFPASNLKLRQNLYRLAELQLLQLHRNGTDRYSAHPAVSQYFYRAWQEDTLLMHVGAAKYLQRALGAGESRVLTRGAVRTRGAALRDRGTDRPRDPAVLAMFQELIYHLLQSDQPEPAFRCYAENLGGFEHIGETLGDYARGTHLTELFLLQADKDQQLAPSMLEQVRQDHERFAAGLIGGAHDMRP